VKKVFKIIGWLLTIPLLLITILFSLSKVYEKKIIQFAVNEINKNITIPVSVDNISFSLLKDFPHATLIFSNLTIGRYSNDSACYIKNLSIGSNIISLWRKDYTISYFEIDDAIISYSVYSDNETNWDFIKSISFGNKTSDSNNTELSLNINKVKLKNVKVTYSNSIKNQFLNVDFPLFIADAKIKGNQYYISTRGGVNVNKFKWGIVNFEPTDKTKLLLNMRVAHDTVVFDNSTIVSKNIELAVDGGIVLSEIPFIDLSIVANSIQLTDIANFIPTEYSKIVKDKKYSGSVTFNALIKGNISKSESPLINSTFSLQNGAIEYGKYLNLKKVSFSGQYTNGNNRNAESSYLQLKNIDLRTDTSYVLADLSITNFLKPLYNFNSRLFVHTKDIQFINSDKFSVTAGTIKGSISTSAYINHSFGNEILKLLLTKSNSNIDINNLSFALPQNNATVSNINATIFQLNHVFKVNNMSCLFNNIKTNTSSIRCQNLYSSLYDNKKIPMKIDGDIIVDNIDYENIKPVFAGSETTQSSGTSEFLYEIKTNAKCSSFTYNKMVFRNIETLLYIDNKNIIGTNLILNSFGGSTRGVFKYSIQNKQAKFDFETVSRGIDIAQLFWQMDNFGQSNLTSEHIKGVADTDLSGSFVVSDSKVQNSSIDVLGTLTVLNGELINYAPVEQLSSFTNISELSHIKFETLYTNFLVSDETVNISNTNIRSNSMDMSIFGYQKFNGDYQYNLRVYLSDILKGKTKKIQQQQTKYGMVEDDGLGRTSLFLVTKCENGNTSTKIDKDQLGKHLKGEIKQEKIELKHTLHKEFGWFKKDTAEFREMNRKEVKKEKPKFEIEWEE